MKKLEMFLFTIVVAVAFVVFPALMQVNASTLDHLGPWLRSLAVAVVVAIGTSGYGWLRAQGYTVTVSKPVPEPPLPNVTYTTSPSASTIYPLPTREVAASPVVLPEGWAANQPQAPEATSVSPPV